MANPLVATKLLIPKPRPGLVDRRGLVERLQEGRDARLVLISAPAGFGKTTLLAAWLATATIEHRATAWLSLDASDNDAGVFWRHLIGALQLALAELGIALSSGLAPGVPPDTVLIASLLNQMADLKGQVHLILDDYHLIEDPAISAGMAYLVEHAPPQLHVVISTRADPALPLARLRARGELVEVRSADLRFTRKDARAYLNDSMSLGLSPADSDLLLERTEGWIAALQLAALSMRGRGDSSAFIADFAGSNRYVVDYLVEEVLQRQPEAVRAFLFGTCILKRLSGPLCDAVTGQSGSGAMIEALEQQNLFVIPLDDRRQWYRYHHLFADVLRAHLDTETLLRLPKLHRRASSWFDRQGDRPEAIHHALAAADFDRAAGLMELAIPEMQRTRREAVIRDWQKALPAELVRNRPVLGIGFVGALTSGGMLDGIEERLRDVETGIAALAEAGASSAPIVVVDQTQLPRVPGAVQLYRAALAQVRGDTAGVIDHAGRVLDLAPADDHLSRAAGSSLLGIAYWSDGRLELAQRFWSEGSIGLQKAGHVADMLGVSIALADISLTRGRLREARQVYEQALQRATAEGGLALKGTADMHAGLVELHRERNDFEAAHHHLSKCEALGELAGLPQHPYRWRVAKAHLLQDEGDREAALALLDDAQRLYVSDFFPDVRPAAAVRARTLIVEGRLDEGRLWQRAAGLGVEDNLPYLREYEHITLARLLLAQEGQDHSAGNGAARAFLERLMEAAERGERNGSIIEISILLAIAQRHDDLDAALSALERALVLAAPEGYVRVFINEGRPMAALLKLATKRGISPAYVRALLSAFGGKDEKPRRHLDLIEPLSERERDVLVLLCTDLGGPEIARELMVSENTMRTHTKNIYEKLGVNNRRAAVRLAGELGLLARR